MAYANPLHPAVPANKTSSYSSLGGALGNGSSFQPEFIIPHRRRLPQAVYAPASKWQQTTGRAANAPISFDYKGYTGQGVPMREFNRPADQMAQLTLGANDLVLKANGAQKINFRILWPGYGHVDWVRSVNVVSSGGCITRAQLGAQVCAIFARFLELNRNERCTIPDYQIGTTRIQFEHLVLVGLHNVMDNVWQADVAIDLR